ncbi:MAG TPA: ATP-binding protein [Candidatus Limnocylindria bacterium]|nr:ATP-binding protein [Candidatus Limnocylindria bacterium]
MRRRLFLAFFLFGAFCAGIALGVLLLAGAGPGMGLAVLAGAAALALLAALASRLAAKWMTAPLSALDPDHPEDASVPDELLPVVRRAVAQNRQVRARMEALEARRDELDALVAGMREGFIALGPNETVILINQSACQMLGVTEEAVLGRHVTEANRSPEMMALLEDLRKAGSGERTLSREGRSLALYGGRLRGREGAVLLLADQTEKVAGEGMRKRFTANVSHELRTPLTTIRGYAELLAAGMVRPEDLERTYGLIERESGRMLRLVEDILHLSKLDEGYPAGRMDRVNLHDVAREAIESFQAAAADKKVTLRYRGSDAFVRGDPTLLMEMCANLLDNAVKYNAEGGTVEAEVRGGGAHVLLRVKDTGIGIAPEHRALVFERFYRVDPSRSKQTGGTGLGLSIVKHAAEFHRAAVGLRSEVGHGTEITVLFPAYREDESGAAAPGATA